MFIGLVFMGCLTTKALVTLSSFNTSDMTPTCIASRLVYCSNLGVTCQIVALGVSDNFNNAVDGLSNEQNGTLL